MVFSCYVVCHNIFNRSIRPIINPYFLFSLLLLSVCPCVRPCVRPCGSVALVCCFRPLVLVRPCAVLFVLVVWILSYHLIYIIVFEAVAAAVLVSLCVVLLALLWFIAKCA